MPSTFFHLIRHGSYALLDDGLGGRADHALNQAGRADADRAADFLAGRPIAAVVSSPVLRARQTAEAICRRLQKSLAIEDAFAEVDFAGWTGKRFSELSGDPAWQAWNRFRGSARVPGGESMLAVQARAVARMLSLADAFADQEVAVVSHGDVIKSVLTHFLGAPLDLLGRIDIAAGSVSQLVLFEQDVRVVGVNLRP